MDPKTNFKLIVIQTELERFKFLVRSFLRARLKKVRFWGQCYAGWMHLLMRTQDRPTPSPYPRTTYCKPRYYAAAPLAVRTTVPHITSSATHTALLLIVPITVSCIVTTARRHNGRHQHGRQAGRRQSCIRTSTERRRNRVRRRHGPPPRSQERRRVGGAMERGEEMGCWQWDG